MDLSILKKIGGTPTDSYGGLSDRINFPCKVTDKSGCIFEKSIISFRKSLPVQYSSNERPLSDATKIEESDFAVPAEIRKKYAFGDESSYGLYPTVVNTPDGRDFIINGVANIIELTGYKTKDLSLSSTPSVDVETIIRNAEDCVYFIAEWNENVEKLRLIPLRK